MKPLSSRHRCPKDIPILMYHHLEPDHPAGTPYAISVCQFEEQLDLLRRERFNTINFQQLWGAISQGMALPRKSVLITFDDGYRSFLDYAAPALQARGMTATAFLVAREIGGFNRWEKSPEIPRRLLMDQKAIEAIVAAGFEIGSHGWAHRDLVNCSRKELEEEMERSSQALQAKFGVRITAFAYPYGRYAQAHYESLARAGYQIAVAATSLIPAGTAGPFALRRVYVHQGDTRFRFFLKLSVWYLRYLEWRDTPADWHHA